MNHIIDIFSFKRFEDGIHLLQGAKDVEYSMAMVNVGHSSVRRAYSPSRLAWSEGRQPLGAPQHSSDEPRVRRP